jgi:3-hydroxyisobutyrate dehydrogenase-like beta-hydroxyacid dehydrogenase
VTVWNRSRPAADALASDVDSPRLRVAGDPADAIEAADVVLCVLADGDVTRDVVLDPAVTRAMRPGVVVCDLGTSGVAAVQALGAALGDHGIRFVDAPVSGSVVSVGAGQVLVMAGGAPADIDEVTPVLSAFAKRVARLGPIGAGQAMKLAVNLVVHDLNAALSEALLLATRAGIDPAAAYDVFQDSAVSAPFVSYKREAFLSGTGPVAMSLDLVAKDLRLIVGLATTLAVVARRTKAAAADVHAACQAGFGDQDMAALTRYLAGRSG